jgi:anionic cell wall polymer biosynthesis LytR-Cps2A-Psr (LCP) family protein
MGLDTRLDENGKPLPQNIYDALHAGDGSNGGNNANVLMLLHVPGDGSPATEISIPRDDYVDLPGCPDQTCKEKIKESYGLAMDQEAKALVEQGVPDSPAREQQERDAGRQEEMKTVSQFLGGVPIDHFVEVTLVAFYEIAQVVAPIPVCVLYPTSDDYSGANFPAGQQQLSATQALAFVRQRRDIGVASGGKIKDYYVLNHLDFTDLDRERRQQAFIASLAYKLKQAGTITSPSELGQILNVAEANIAVDSGLNLIDFAGEASNLTGGHVSFHTLPIVGPMNAGTASHRNDVNQVDVPAVQADVRSLLGGSAVPSSSSAPAPTTANTPPPAAPVDVYNASGQAHVAATLSDALTTKGFTKGTTGTDSSRSTSVIEYGSGASSTATAVSSALGGIKTESSSVISAGHVRVIIGRDFSMPAGLGSGGAPSAPPPSQPAPSNNGNNDADNDPMSSISGGGVPCVK